MRTIPLTQGKVALVDDQDYLRISQYKWHAARNRSGNWYARRSATPDQPCRHMHWLVLRVSEVEVDHENGDGLDNQRHNLRVVTHRQNAYNRVGRRGKATKGVCWHKQKNCWRAYIAVEYRQIHLGLFKTPEDAARAYDTAALKYFGSFARLNFPLLQTQLAAA